MVRDAAARCLLVEDVTPDTPGVLEGSRAPELLRSEMRRPCETRIVDELKYAIEELFIRSVCRNVIRTQQRICFFHAQTNSTDAADYGGGYPGARSRRISERFAAAVANDHRLLTCCRSA